MASTACADDGFVAAHAASVRALVSRRVPASAVDDVCQDIWLAWWQARSADRAILDPEAFLHTLATRRVADFYRAGRSRAGEHLPAGLPTRPDDEPLESILRHVNVVPGSLMWRRVVDGYTLPELAQEFALPLGTVKSRLHHERRSLARRLHDWRHPEAGSRPLALCPCPVCRRMHQLAMTASVPTDWHQALSVTVSSTLAMRVDATLRHFYPLAEPVDVVSQSRGWPRPTQIETVHRRSLLSRWGPAVPTPDGQPQVGFTLQPEDAAAVMVHSQLSAADSERLGLVQAGREGFMLRVPVTPSRDLDDTLWLQLPANARLEAASPSPVWVGAVHGAAAVLWRHTRSLPTFPTAVARWDRG